MKILINSMLLDKEEFSDQRFNTIMFDQLLKTSCKDFLTNAKQARSDWINNPKKFDQANPMSEFTNLYTNFYPTGNWDKADEEQTNIISLTTELKDTKAQVAKLSKAPKTPSTTGNAWRRLEAWKFENVGKFKTVDNVKHVWCKEHGRKDTDGVGGMNMKLPHKHLEWNPQRDAGRIDCKEGRKDKRAAKCKASESGPNPASSNSANSATLSLAKYFKTALTSRFHMSDVEANYLVDQAMN